MKCIPGAAYLYEDWTNEKEWHKRKKVLFCWKCGRRVVQGGGPRYRYKHIKEKQNEAIIHEQTSSE